MANIIDTFKDHFRNITGMTTDEAMSSLKVQDDVTARSGKNITMGDNIVPITGVGNKYGKVLKDAIKFYQDEFKVTPRANIIFDPDELPSNALGTADTRSNKDGQYVVDLRHLSDAEVAEAEDIARSAEKEGWSPKNNNTISHVPIHELGHVLSFQLFPNRQKIYKLYVDSLRDIGTDLTSPSDTKNKTTDISIYATTDPYEAVAESLADYYQNRDKSSKLTMAIVKRMKNKGSLYGLTQSGGVRTPNETFAQNLRRYQAIQ